MVDPEPPARASRASRAPEALRRLRRAARHRARRRHESGSGWRLAVPAAFAGAGMLLVTSAVNADGQDLRPERYQSLADLAEQQSDRLTALRGDITSLNADVDELSAGLRSPALDRVQRRVDALEMPAGLRAVEGPGLTVVLDDAPEKTREAIDDPTTAKAVIVHQQDIQAVANALWAGGAEAMTLQGQRVISTTGIKCVGNSVILQGVPYSPPYVISAIGDSASMVGALGESPYISSYLDAVKRYGLGWRLEPEASVEAPAFTGSLDLRYAAVDEDAAGSGRAAGDS